MELDIISYLLGLKAGGPATPILSGAASPTSDLGKNEDIYVQYTEMSSTYDFRYGIAAIYRKVNGTWEPYTDPAPPNAGIHVWTKSTGGTDASMWTQAGYMDTSTGTFIPTAEAVAYLYRDVSIPVTLNNIATLEYANNIWTVTALVLLTNGTTTYQPEEAAAWWSYQSTIDFTIWRP